MSTENVLMEIVIGTYEKFLLGYNLEMNEDKFALKPSFTTEAHLQSVKCIASSEKFIASGSTDETVQLFNMHTRKELGALLQHNGTVTSLEFYDNYLFSCSEDSTICIWSTKNWKCQKTLYGHKNSVNSISIHPSGKMALSVAKDKSLRTWNLIKGRCAYVTNIKKVAEKVSCSPDGTRFLVSADNSIDVYECKNAAVASVIKFEQKICDFTFVTDELLAVAGESEFIRIYNLKTEVMCCEIDTKATRIKAINAATVNDETFLVSVSSDGCIKVWHLDLSEEKLQYQKVAKVKTGSRPTCMTVMVKSQISIPPSNTSTVDVPEVSMDAPEVSMDESEVSEDE